MGGSVAAARDPQAVAAEIADASAHNDQSLRSEQGGLQARARPIAADPPAGGDNPMVREAGQSRETHDVATARAARGRPASAATSP